MYLDIRYQGLQHLKCFANHPTAAEMARPRELARHDADPHDDYTGDDAKPHKEVSDE